MEERPRLEERVERLERWHKRAKILSMVKLTAYTIVILGIVVYLYNINAAAGEWRIDVGVPEIYPAGLTDIGVRIPVQIYNPSDRIMAKLIYYRIYVNGYYVGDGMQPYLDVPEGWSNHTLEFRVDLTRIGCGLASTLASGQNLTLEIRGYAMVDLYVFGKLPWRTVTITFDKQVSNIEIPDLGAATRALELMDTLCRSLGAPGEGEAGGGGFPLPLPFP